ncbi:hypothetical protein ABZ137_09400 [Streptomyces bobili]|uniref:hypothetical protein n=1 Tax=Streptomyces bobili TaxID=67280 RepID=UPI0033AA5706
MADPRRSDTGRAALVGVAAAGYLTGEFRASCLGKVPTWNRERGGLTPNPIAVFL